MTKYSGPAATFATIARHEHPPESGDLVGNTRDFHAFALVGRDTLFASHLTMFNMDAHEYQVVIEIRLQEPWRSALAKARIAAPHDTFFLANAMEDAAIGNTISDPFTVPELASTTRKAFVGNIFQGIPPADGYDDWPWKGVRPVLANISVEVVRVVHFRPFVPSLTPPDPLVYLLFGQRGEAHMANVQTRYPDFDHVLTLKEAPPWLAPDMLQASILVDMPDLPRLGPDDTRVRCRNPIENGSMVDVRYRGEGKRRMVCIDYTSWFCTKILNMGDPGDPCAKCTRCGSPTPQAHMVGARQALEGAR